MNPEAKSSVQRRIIDGILAGQSLAEIATDNNLTTSAIYRIVARSRKRFHEAFERAKDVRRSILDDALYARQKGIRTNEAEVIRDGEGTVLKQIQRVTEVPGSERLLEAYAQKELGYSDKVELTNGPNWSKIAEEIDNEDAD